MCDPLIRRTLPWAALLLAASCGPKHLPSGTPTEPGDQQSYNMGALRTSELAYDEAFGGYVAAEPNPVTAELVDGTARPWGTPADFDTLYWSPDSDVTGSYWCS
jgi:hypothetical protein